MASSTSEVIHRISGVDGYSSRGSKRVNKPPKVEAKPPCYVRCSGFLVENSAFISLTTILTIYALTGDDFRIIFTEKPADLWFNVMVLVCIAIFSFEIVISVMGKSDYWLGFFFILDLVSTVTLVLDLTWINDLLAGNGDSSSLRSGRTARIGAKAARMIRVLRLVRILKLYKALYEAGRERARRKQQAALRATAKGEDDEWDEQDDEALVDAEETAVQNQAGQESTLGKKLSEMTTRRVIILILAMMVILPLLQVDDFTQSPFSAEYGADQVMESFKDYDASGSITDRARYWHSMLTYVYYHNWYAGKGLQSFCRYSETVSCSNGFWAHLYFVGIRGNNESLVTGKAGKARLNFTVVESFDRMSEAEPAAIYNLGSLPTRAQELLAAEWNTDCPVTTGSYLKGVSIIAEELAGVSYVVACPQDLRVTESLRYSPVWQTRSAFDEWRFEFYFDVRPFNTETAIFSLATTSFVLVLLLAGSLMFSRDANRLIVNPVEQMIRRVKEIRDNPLIAMQMADDEFKLEELRKYRQKRQGCFSRVLSALSSCRCFTANKDGPMETVILEKTIIKLGSLLALGFGEAGANIISHNMKGSDSAGVNAILPGMKVDCVIGLCRVLDFGTATEVLQGRIMTFVNQIAEIIHGVVDEFHGSPNKNSGDQFLVIWRMDTGNNVSRWEDLDHKKVVRQRIAEMSILAFCKILGALHRSALLADYRTHPGLQYRLQVRNGSEASEVRVNLSFGLHAGWAIEGAVGSEFKIDASYVSPNVNIASSVERCTQVYGVSVVVAQSCMELCSLEFMNKGRLIDRVLLSGSSAPMRLYCVDLDFWSLDVDRSRGPLVALSTKNRYRARQFIASQKQDKWSEESRMVTAFDSDPSIGVMRQRYSIEFFQLFNMGYQNYSQGEWLVARRMLAETKHLLGVEDGPSAALLRFMEDPYQFECPKDWNEVRDLSSMLS